MRLVSEVNSRLPVLVYQRMCLFFLQVKLVALHIMIVKVIRVLMVARACGDLVRISSAGVQITGLANAANGLLI